MTTEVDELKLRIKELELENAILRRKLNPQVRAFSPDMETPIYHFRDNETPFIVGYDDDRR